MDEVHKTRGKICSYVLRCEGDRIYCGHTKDLEVRMLQHTGASPGGAKFCLEHPPQEILSVKIHESVAEALAMECANFNLWCGKLQDFDKVRDLHMLITLEPDGLMSYGSCHPMSF